MTEENKGEIFAKNLKAIRIFNKLSQKQVADKLGVPVSTYAN